MTTPTIDIRHNPDAGRFEIQLPDGLGVCEYHRQDDGVMTITHTEVPPSAAGKGIAATLVRAALDWARAEGLRVRPLCSYAASYMQRKPDTQDLLV